MTDQTAPQQIELQGQWITDPTAVPTPVNQFMIQAGPSLMTSAGPDTFFLTLGHMVPPLIPNFESAEQAQAFAENNYAYVQPVGNFTFSLERLRDLSFALNNLLQQIDENSAG